MEALGILAIVYLFAQLIIMIGWTVLQVLSIPFRILRAIHRHRQRTAPARRAARASRVARAPRQRKKGGVCPWPPPTNVWTDSSQF